MATAMPPERSGVKRHGKLMGIGRRVARWIAVRRSANRGSASIWHFSCRSGSHSPDWRDVEPGLSHLSLGHASPPALPVPRSPALFRAENAESQRSLSLGAVGASVGSSAQAAKRRENPICLHQCSAASASRRPLRISRWCRAGCVCRETPCTQAGAGAADCFACHAGHAARGAYSATRHFLILVEMAFERNPNCSNACLSDVIGFGRQLVWRSFSD